MVSVKTKEISKEYFDKVLLLCNADDPILYKKYERAVKETIYYTDKILDKYLDKVVQLDTREDLKDLNDKLNEQIEKLNGDNHERKDD